MILKDWIDEFKAGRFEKLDFGKAVKIGWTDWNCPEDRIKGKTYKCAKILCKIRSPRLLSENVELCNRQVGGRDVDTISFLGEAPVVISLPSVGFEVSLLSTTRTCDDASSCARIADELADA